jgi:hypothetical protein
MYSFKIFKRSLLVFLSSFFLYHSLPPCIFLRCFLVMSSTQCWGSVVCKPFCWIRIRNFKQHI